MSEPGSSASGADPDNSNMVSKLDYFKDVVVAASGTFMRDIGPLQIGQWVQAHGGEYSDGVDEYVTHLIVSKMVWEQRGDSK
jgi:hypothetical protein